MPSLVFCRLTLRVEYTCCKMIRRPKRCGCEHLMIKAWWVVHSKSLFAQSYIIRPLAQPAMVMAIAPDSLSLHYAQSNRHIGP
jgi:hypothetical protein